MSEHQSDVNEIQM